MSGQGKVWFVGAGPGAPDLLTFRAAHAIAAADVVVWAASLVNEAVLKHARPGAEIVDSSRIALEEVIALYRRARDEGLVVARLQSGDPALYGAMQEQIDACDRIGLDWEIVPGVSSLGAAAAALGRELTIPEVAQSVILTRLASRTPMPPGEQVRAFAAHRTTLAIFLSAARPKQLQEELLAGGYPPETPCAVAYRVSWPDELVFRCRLDELAGRIRKAKIHKTALVLVGDAIAASGTRSHLYHPEFAHEFRNRKTKEADARP